jgi:phosphohistidine phosphatase
MRELLLMRHAKSDWDTGPGGDRERPLADRGVKTARRMGRLLTAAEHVPELVLCSPAVRARATLELAAEAGGWSCPVEVAEALYGGDVEAVIELLVRIPEQVTRALLVGHEPVWSQLAARLVGGGSLAMPTAAVACVGFAEGSWSEVGPGRGTLQWLVTPRLLK